MLAASPTAPDVFVVGVPRSGTTWVQSVLSQHPSVVTLPETEAFEVISYLLQHWNHRRKWRPDMATGLESVITRDDYLEWASSLWTTLRTTALQVQSAATRVLEKTPHHIQSMPVIREVYGPGGAQFVIVVRDPRDVIRSMLEAGESWAKSAFPTTVQEAARNYIKLIESGVAHQHDSDTIVVRYEDLKAGDSEWQRLLTFLHLDDMALPDTSGVPAEMSAEQVVLLVDGRPQLGTLPLVDGHSFQTRPADMRRDLTPFERRYIEWRCRSLMQRFRYDGWRKRRRPDDLAHVALLRLRFILPGSMRRTLFKGLR